MQLWTTWDLGEAVWDCVSRRPGTIGKATVEVAANGVTVEYTVFYKDGNGPSTLHRKEKELRDLHEVTQEAHGPLIDLWLDAREYHLIRELLGQKEETE